MRDPSTDARKEVLGKVADKYNLDKENKLSNEETNLVEDIFRALTRSAEVEIRKALAENIKNSDSIPKDIAMKMAQDVAEVANPILQYSQVLSDADLLEILASSKDISHAMAIARRDNLPESVTTMLIDQKNQEISSQVLNSFGSNISDASYEKIIENHLLNEDIVSAILDKGSISVTLTEKLLKRVSSQIRTSLNQKYQVVFDNKHLKKEMEKNLELAATKIIGIRSADAHNKKMLADLDRAGKLMPLTALSTCNYQMFELAMSRLARVPINNVRILIYDHGETGLKRLCQQAGLPEKLFAVISIAVRALQSFEGEFMNQHRPSIKPKDMLERIKLLTGENKIDYLDFFISLMKVNSR